MSMTTHEAETIARDPLYSHATVTLDLAATVLASPIKDLDTLRQLAEAKAILQRLEYTGNKGTIG